MAVGVVLRYQPYNSRISSGLIFNEKANTCGLGRAAVVYVTHSPRTGHMPNSHSTLHSEIETRRFTREHLHSLIAIHLIKSVVIGRSHGS